MRLLLAGVNPVSLLSLQCGKEALSHGVIPTISLSAHALREAFLGQSEAEFAACILTSLIGVEHNTVETEACVPSVDEGSLNQVVRHPIRQAVTQHLARLNA
ncbi:hypothetical protein D3C76_1122650 [compost metagenome]